MKKTKQRYRVSLLICVGLFLMSCTSQKQTGSASTENESYIVSAPIIIKNFVNKGGEVTSREEIYIQRSIQDYFIKFCESNISQKELEDYLSGMAETIKVVTLEIEYRDGPWDSCDENNIKQSRIGKYVVVHRIIKDW